MDITEVILEQHHQQRRMFATLDDLYPGDPTTLSPVWERLKVLLEVHAEAEELFFYPQLLRIGAGPGKQHGPADETSDAIKDHNEIRDAIAQTDSHPVGSKDWWAGVRATRTANGDHMAEEERDDLVDFRRQAGLQLRHDIAVEFTVYEAQHAGGVDSADKDPDSYVDNKGVDNGERHDRQDA